MRRGDAERDDWTSKLRTSAIVRVAAARRRRAAPRRMEAQPLQEIMSMSVTMREMLEAGVHFGHQTRYWNPKMAPYIFGHRNKIHIVNLEKTLAMYQDALKFVRQLAANKGTVLFVGTKRQAREIIREEAQRCGAPYVDYRWLGGMLTNYKTVKQSIKRLKDMERCSRTARSTGCRRRKALRLPARDGQARPQPGRHQGHERPARRVVRDRRRLPEGRHGGSEQARHPGDRRGRHEPRPDGVDYVIPGNDDSSRAIRLYARGIADAVLEGRKDSLKEIVRGGDEFVEVEEDRECLSGLARRRRCD